MAADSIMFQVYLSCLYNIIVNFQKLSTIYNISSTLENLKRNTINLMNAIEK